MFQYDTIISIPKYRIDELKNLKTGDCVEIYDDNGIIGYLERVDDESYCNNVEIEGCKFIFNYYFPNKVKVRFY